MMKQLEAIMQKMIVKRLALPGYVSNDFTQYHGIMSRYAINKLVLQLSMTDESSKIIPLDNLEMH